MKFKNPKILQMVAMVTAFLAIDKIPIVEGKVGFSDDQEKKLKAQLSQESLDDLIKAFNQEIAANEDVQNFQAQISQLLAENNATVEDVATAAAAAEQNGTDLSAQFSQIKALIDAQTATINKLVGEAHPDSPLAQITGALNTKLKHSATHLFASTKAYDAFADRPWNARAAGITVSAADYSDDLTIQKLNGDAQLFFRENPTMLQSLHRDNFGLPSFWPKRLKVDSTVVSGSVLTAEITQGRKFGWLPKNNQVIEPEEGRIFPVQIDAQWSGAKLQEIEDSWLNFMNKEGSQPEKWSFVRFLVTELMKQARVEDRISTINGIYVKTPDNAEEAGKMINRQNGLLYQLWKAREITKKYRPFNVGAPTVANIYDYLHDPVTGIIELLPKDVKNAPGLKLYMEKKWWDAYKAKYKEINGQNMDYNGAPEYPENYSNIEVVPLIDMEGTGFMFFTFGDNIEILENIPAEKAAFKFQQILRDLHLMADYKLGVRLIHIGRKINPSEPEQFRVQSVWSNNMPIFKNSIFAPVFDPKSGEIKFDYKNLEVHSSWDTDITTLSGVVEGQVVKIKGNTSMANAKNVKDNANFLIEGDFNLKLGGTLTLRINENLKAVEMHRTTAPEVAPELVPVEFDATVVDAAEGNTFVYTGTADRTMTNIVNGYEGQTIRIYGNDEANMDLTFHTAGNINVGADAVLSAAAHYIDLTLDNGVWYKVKLSNA